MGYPRATSYYGVARGRYYTRPRVASLGTPCRKHVPHETISSYPRLANQLEKSPWAVWREVSTMAVGLGVAAQSSKWPTMAITLVGDK